MGAIGGLLGLNGGANGSGFSAPSGANVVNPTNNNQIGGAYSGVQSGLTNQNGLLTALQSQNGLNNQSNVYNQLQGIVNGTGPNPAQTALNNNTGANVANQAALAAGQRGANSNAGLIARQAAQTGGNLQQQAVGQAANLQANQSLNALGQAGNIANTQVSNQIGQTNANTAANQAEQSQLLGAQQGVNNANVSNQASINSGNAALASQTMQGQQAGIGGLLNGLGSLFADGGAVDQSAFKQPQSKFGQFLKATSNQSQPGTAAAPQAMTGANALQQGVSSFVKGIGGGNKPAVAPADDESYELDLAQGGKVPAMVSPGEKYLSPGDVQKVKAGANPMEVGEKIQGKRKAKGPVNSYADDTVPKTLEEGGIVLPNSVTQSKHPHWEAHKFVKAIMAKKGLK